MEGQQEGKQEGNQTQIGGNILSTLFPHPNTIIGPSWY